ncbi:hypothetical protein NDU88_002521 [Pleurodeles waltl]|uniref:Uncharacterized protein n=1 Tax=Pleurodeles waltl TaxID=8319 RepID=A0AAV7U9I6_PLEWA|nr:hypothetical protein NDU88_002521 [Pleurodeles waltl]
MAAFLRRLLFEASKGSGALCGAVYPGLIELPPCHWALSLAFVILAPWLAERLLPACVFLPKPGNSTQMQAKRGKAAAAKEGRVAAERSPPSASSFVLEGRVSERSPREFFLGRGCPPCALEGRVALQSGPLAVLPWSTLRFAIPVEVSPPVGFRPRGERVPL